MRPDEPPPPSSEDAGATALTALTKLVDVLRLDVGDAAAIESHTIEPHRPENDAAAASAAAAAVAAEEDGAPPRSPLRGGRRGGFGGEGLNGALEGLESFAGAASRLAATPRPQSSPTLAARARLHTAPGGTAPIGSRRGSDASRIAQLAAQAAQSARCGASARGESALGAARWYGTTWHRPITPRHDARPASMRPATSNGGGAAAGTALVPPPTAGMSERGLAGGVTTQRAQQNDQARALLGGGGATGQGRRQPSLSAAAPWIGDAGAAADGSLAPISAVAPVQMHSSLPPPATSHGLPRRPADGTIGLASTLLELPPGAGYLYGKSGRGAWDASDEDAPAQMLAPPATAHGGTGRRPLGALRSNNAVARMARKHAMSRQFQQQLRGPKAPGMGARVVGMAGAHKAGVVPRTLAPMQRVSGVPAPELPLIGGALPMAGARQSAGSCWE